LVAVILKRIVLLIPVMLITSFFSYGLVLLIPGDPARMILEAEQQATPSQEQLRAFKARHGLDKPFLTQYADWLGKVLHGDLGKSLTTQGEILPAYMEKLGATATLFMAGLTISIVIALPLGVLTAMKASSVMDQVLRITTLGCISLPCFWWGILLVFVASVKLRWLPAFGYGRTEHFILPALTLGITGAMDLTRLTRASVLEVLRQNFVRTARAKGLEERTVLIRHVLRNALIPVITAIGLHFSHLVGGTVLIETLFAWPGVGRYLVQASGMRDIPVIQGIVLMSTVFFLLLNLVIDLAYTILDPRISTKGRGR